ncbi:MAG TPA: hypothetical protein VN397_03090 [Candidatus Methylomirabilis sp.]|nr:hypothetical protein [Candidatus Methylomirabilis sp.]
MEQHTAMPGEQIFRITDIEVAMSQIDDKIVGIFRFESSGPLKRGPILLVIAEINGTGYVYDQLIDTINEEAERSRNLTIEVDADPVTRFEKIVQNLNDAVGRFLEREPTPINWSRVNIYVIELSEGHLCLTGLGQLMNMFLQKQGDGSFKTYDLFGSLEQPVDVNPKKVFASIICGDVNMGDVLVAGSRNLDRLRNELRMKERLTTLPPVTAALEIRQDLERQAIPDDFVAVVVAAMPSDQPKPLPPVPVEPQGKSTASIERLRMTEASTTRQLAPSIAPRNADTTKGEPLAPIIGGPLGLLNKMRRLVSKERVRDVATMTSLRGMNAGFGTFLTKKRKSLLVGIVALTLLILVIGSLVKYQRTVAAERAAWNSTYDGAKGIIERAQGESVYSEDKARRSLSEADALLTGLDVATNDRKQAVDKLKDGAKELKEKLRRLVTVPQPAQIYALPTEIADGALLSPILFKGNLVAADRSSRSIVALNLTTRDAKKITLPDGAANPVALAPGRESVIVAMDDGKLFAVNVASGDVGPLSIGSGKAQAMTDIVYYANRLYRLDATGGQIWRYPSASGGFGSEQAYLQAASTNLNNAVSLAIDSNVYVLTSNGQMARFYAGGQDGFSLSPVDPPLQSGNAMWTMADGQYVGVADSQNKRALLFTKEGRLVAQYVSPAFKGPRDLVADEATKKMYVVDGNALYELALP